MKKIFILLFFCFFISACDDDSGFVMQMDSQISALPAGACSAGYKTCSDGSVVARVAPSCEFEECPYHEGCGADKIMVDGTCTPLDTVVFFSDAVLEKTVRDRLDLTEQEALTVAMLQGLQEIRSFDPRGIISTLDGLQFCTRLESLELPGHAIEDVTVLHGLTDLHYLDLSDNNVTDITPLDSLYKLEKLFLSRNVIADFTPIANFAELRELDLSHTAVSEVGFLSGLMGLTRLVLSGNEIKDTAPLAYLVNLTELWLDSNAGINIDSLATLTELKILILHSNGLQAVTHLEDLAKLTRLDLSYNELLDISPLEGLTQMTNLNLSHNSIVDINFLNGLTKLEKLYLSSNSITDVSVLEGLYNSGAFHSIPNAVLLTNNNLDDDETAQSINQSVIDYLLSNGVNVSYGSL
ncbi:MAG: leucine-rich repeat domain-containing protein [Deltaproteobacteria bacterium]|nr:leucine-rich repeat domain-containing protein [Deltaproteobacteria bacterium]